MSHDRHVRRGYTLVELLVAFAIVAVLVGLLLSAVQKVRARAARTADENNLRQVGLAVHGYDTQHRRLPPLIDGKNYPQDIPGGDAKREWYVPIGMLLAPHLDGPSVTSIYAKPGYAFTSLVVPAYVSPSDSTHTRGRLDFDLSRATAQGNGVCNYAFNVWVFSGDDSYGPTGEGGAVTWWMLERRATVANGFPDGTSQTLMLATKRGRCGPTGGSTLASAWPSSRYLTMGSHPASQTTAAFFGLQLLTPEGEILTTFQDRPSAADCNPDYSQGFTRGQITVGMADGSVRAVSAGVDPKLWHPGLMPADGAGLPAD